MMENTWSETFLIALAKHSMFLVSIFCFFFLSWIQYKFYKLQCSKGPLRKSEFTQNPEHD